MIKYKDIIVYAKFDDGDFRNAFGVELASETGNYCDFFTIKEKYKLEKEDFDKLEVAIAVTVASVLKEIEKSKKRRNNELF